MRSKLDFAWQKFGKLLEKCYWLILATFGYLAGTIIFFTVFNRNKLGDFIRDNALVSHRLTLVIFIAIFVGVFLAAGKIYQDTLRPKINQIFFLLVASAPALWIRGMGIGGKYIFLVYLAGAAAYLLQQTIFKKLPQKIKNPKVVLAVVLAFFFLAYSAYSIIRHDRFESNAFDLGIFTQFFYKLSHLNFGENTVRALPNLWGDHFHPILLPLSFFMWIYRGPETLLVLQALGIVLGGIPLYLLARDILKNKWGAILLVIAYLLYVGFQKGIDFDFHEIAFMPVLFLLTFYLMHKKKWGWYFLSLIPLLAVKEDVSILVAFLGLYLILFKREYKIGLATAVIGAGWFLTVTKYVIPALGSSGFNYFEYSQLGDTPKQAVVTILTNPLHSLYALANNEMKISTLWQSFASFGFLSLLSPAILFLAIPTIGENLWNDNLARWQGFHYNMSPAPVLAIAAIFGIAALAYYFSRHKDKMIIFLSLFAVLASAAVSLNENTALGRMLNPSFYRLPQATYDVRALVKDVPSEAQVSAQSNIVPQLAARNFIYNYPRNKYELERQMDFYLFSTDLVCFPYTPATQVDMVRDFINDRKDFCLYKRQNGAFLFKRGCQNDPGDYAVALKYLDEKKAQVNESTE